MKTEMDTRKLKKEYKNLCEGCFRTFTEAHKNSARFNAVSKELLRRGIKIKTKITITLEYDNIKYRKPTEEILSKDLRAISDFIKQGYGGGAVHHHAIWNIEKEEE